MDSLVITFAHTVNLLYQYWIHTETFEVHGWFGTYREFVPGVTTNPLKQAVAGWGHLIQKVKAAPDLKNRALCLIRPPGWVPEK